MKSVIVIKWTKALMIILIMANLPLQLAGQLVTPTATGASDTQRNALQSVLAAGDLLCGAAVSIPKMPNATMDMLQQKFDTLRVRYTDFKNSLDPQQLKTGADQLADLDEGLAIIGRLFVIDHDQTPISQINRTQALKTAGALKQTARRWCKKLQRDSKSRLQIN
jgi:hypothetical protein